MPSVQSAKSGTDGHNSQGREMEVGNGAGDEDVMGIMFEDDRSLDCSFIQVHQLSSRRSWTSDCFCYK